MSDNGYELPPPEIHDRGRGPEIKGTRITVFDVMDYHPKYAPAWIADLFRLPVPHVELAIRYVEEHRAELLPKYDEMLAFAAEGNPPHIREWLDGARERLLARKQELARQRARGASDDGAARGQ
jgi:hypothetical protein